MGGQKKAGIFQKCKKAVKIVWFKFKEVEKVILGLELDINLETGSNTSREADPYSSLEIETNDEFELKSMGSALRQENSLYIQHTRFSLSTLDSMVSLTSHAVRHIPKFAHHLYQELWLDFHANNNFTYVNEGIVHENEDNESLNFGNPIDSLLQNKRKQGGKNSVEEAQKNDLEFGNRGNDFEGQEEDINPIFLIEDEKLESRGTLFVFRRLSDAFSGNVGSCETLGETNFNDISDLGSFGSEDTMVSNISNNVPFSIGWFINRSDGLDTLVNFVVRNELLSLEACEDKPDVFSLHSNPPDTATNAGILNFILENDYGRGEDGKAR